MIGFLKDSKNLFEFEETTDNIGKSDIIGLDFFDALELFNDPSTSAKADSKKRFWRKVPGAARAARQIKDIPVEEEQDILEGEPEVLSRVEELAVLLTSDKPKELYVPPCLGFFHSHKAHDSQGHFGFVFTKPGEISRDSRLVSILTDPAMNGQGAPFEHGTIHNPTWIGQGSADMEMRHILSTSSSRNRVPWEDKDREPDYDQWEGKFPPFETIDTLGNSPTATVDRVCSINCGIVMARKLINCKPKQRKVIARTEIKCLKGLRHPHIVAIVGAYLDGKSVGILLYPAAEQFMVDVLHVHGKAQRCSLRRYFVCLAQAVSYLHDLNIRHKDIKPTNILVDRQLTEFRKFRESGDEDKSFHPNLDKVEMWMNLLAKPHDGEEEDGRRDEMINAIPTILSMLAYKRNAPRGIDSGIDRPSVSSLWESFQN
ncbi:hypothetical protein MMC31_005919, partial [Peltigera leucophlebia]|nr:hypothetical protein [Peltigera leucophlebia]